jgi:hypothetical protein
MTGGKIKNKQKLEGQNEKKKTSQVIYKPENKGYVTAR